MLKRKKLHGKTACFRCEDRKTDHKNGLSASLLRKRIQEKNIWAQPVQNWNNVHSGTTPYGSPVNNVTSPRYYDHIILNC